VSRRELVLATACLAFGWASAFLYGALRTANQALHVRYEAAHEANEVTRASLQVTDACMYALNARLADVESICSRAVPREDEEEPK
jgi:hypothetical protein